MDTQPLPILLNEIQGNVTPGFRKDFQALLFVRFPNRAAGQTWVGQLYEEVASAEEVATFNSLYRLLRHPEAFGARPSGWTPPQRKDRRVARHARGTWINVAFTARGLVELGADLTAFPLAFTEGLLFRATNNEIFQGLTSEWTVRDETVATDPADRLAAHAVAIVGADSREELEAELLTQYRRLAELEMLLVHEHRGASLGGGREHFGFRDSVSQPDPDDPLGGWTWLGDEQRVAPGEFILGCPNESGTDAPEHELARNGSYLVFLQLSQDVARFRATMQRESERLVSAGVAMTSARMAAKTLGRWPSGVKLDAITLEDPVPTGTPKASQMQILASDFASDVHGDGCPLFAHVRKAHPRGTIDDAAAVETRPHRIIRRGIPYGPKLPDGTDDDGVERGLLFLAYQADPARQFEHIFREWLNDPTFPDNGFEPGWDAWIGIHPPQAAAEEAAIRVEYHIPGRGGANAGDFVELTLERVVRARGGAYLFSPSIPALAALAEGTFHP